MTHYRIEVLDGYTDGRPSWRKAPSQRRCHTREQADKEKLAFMQAHPKDKYRVRKVGR